MYHVERIVSGHATHKKLIAHAQNSAKGLLESPCRPVIAAACVSGAPAGPVYEKLDMETWESVEKLQI